jgi:hypothetical protein
VAEELLDTYRTIAAVRELGELWLLKPDTKKFGLRVLLAIEGDDNDE